MPRHAISLLLLLAVTLLGLPPRLEAWGQVGHRTVGLIAERNLNEETRYAVRELLDGDSLAEVSTWADDIKSNPDWNYASPWHYVNVEDDEEYETAPKSPGGDVIEAIRRMEVTLTDHGAPKQQRAEALKFLVHFIGDIHQPLHMGRRSDRGGNDVKVRWFGRETNLHTVWDSSIISNWELSYTELADFLDIPSGEQRQQWESADVMTWAKESRAYRSKLYEIGDGNLGYRYAYVHGDYLKQRLAQAGIRLAAVLNRIFSSSR